jgi:hypothetical protein
VAISRGQLVTLMREAMDAEQGERWSQTLLLAVLDGTFSDEWSNILNAAPYYRFATRTVLTDSDGRVSYTQLSDTTVPDAEENFYRVLAVYDEASLYTETEYRNIPMGLVGSWMPQYPKQFYQAGEFFQTLPPYGGLGLTVTVNWKPTAIRDLSSDGTLVDFPAGNEMLLATEAGGRALQLKAGAEAEGAQRLFAAAERYRSDLLTDLARRTIRPRLMGYPDARQDWGG